MPTISFHSGARFTVEFTDDAVASLAEAEAGVPGNQAACKAQLRQLLKRLAETGRLNSPEQFRAEGDRFFAVKARCGLRAYGWFHAYRRGVFVVSHVILKKKDKLDPADIDRANRNMRALYRSEGHV